MAPDLHQSVPHSVHDMHEQRGSAATGTTVPAHRVNRFAVLDNTNLRRTPGEAQKSAIMVILVQTLSTLTESQMWRLPRWLTQPHRVNQWCWSPGSGVTAFFPAMLKGALSALRVVLCSTRARDQSPHLQSGVF